MVVSGVEPRRQPGPRGTGKARGKKRGEGWGGGRGGKRSVFFRRPRSSEGWRARALRCKARCTEEGRVRVEVGEGLWEVVIAEDTRHRRFSWGRGGRGPPAKGQPGEGKSREGGERTDVSAPPARKNGRAPCSRTPQGAQAQCSRPLPRLERIGDGKTGAAFRHTHTHLKSLSLSFSSVSSLSLFTTTPTPPPPPPRARR